MIEARTSGPVRTPGRPDAYVWLRLVQKIAAALVLATVAIGLALGCSKAGEGVEPPDFTAALPGAEAPGPDLARRLAVAWASRDPGYRPRTRHLDSHGSPLYTNRLFLEPSPYLRQHAHNPVNWFPWGDEAFATARRLHRPVFLSVGYSTCHWCHVMEEESFEDDSIARYLNQNYVAIKVDREERPDVDAVYMTAVQMITGSGGWPMSVWLTPDREPFYGGTYFPAHDGDRGASVGFLTLLERLRQAYDQQPDRIASGTLELSRAIRQALAGASATDSLPGPPVLVAALQAYASAFDSLHGGLSRDRKFPSDLSIRFLLRRYHETGDEKALAMARLTLERMASGGIFDQIGGGFHRYSTDPTWLVPHFEKMLYDNALLVMAYLEAWQVTSDSSFARTARAILRYVQRDMTSSEGGFYSASDADSPGPDGRREEGRFYTWTPHEIESALGKKRVRIVEPYFGVTSTGNFEGRSILSIQQTEEQGARGLGISPAAFRAIIDQARDALYAARLERQPPLRDDKILAAWNGLMISAYARAALILGEPEYARRAERAAEFVLGRMRVGGELMRSYENGRTRHLGYLEDYAFMIGGLLDLYEATGHVQWLEESMALDQTLALSYGDDKNGGYFLTATNAEPLLAREKPGDDGAEPSGNSVEALNLLRLAEFTGNDRYRVRADRTLEAFGRTLKGSPTALAEMLLALDFRLDRPKQVVIVARTRKQAEPLLQKLRATYLPNRVVVVAVEGPDLARQAKLVPLLESKVAQTGGATAYVCERGRCELPTSDPAVFARQLAPARSGGRTISGASPATSRSSSQNGSSSPERRRRIPQ